MSVLIAGFFFSNFVHCMIPLLALSGRYCAATVCPVLGAKRPSLIRRRVRWKISDMEDSPQQFGIREHGLCLGDHVRGRGLLTGFQIAIKSVRNANVRNSKLDSRDEIEFARHIRVYDFNQRLDFKMRS